MRRVRALTLIEVVASLVIVATSAVALLHAQGKSLEQLRNLREQEMASHLARELITSWQLDPSLARSAGEGSFESAAGWSWKRASMRSLLAMDTDVEEISLTVYVEDTEGKRQVTQLTWLERLDDRMR